ncbi:MAG: hypothetical protein IJB98_01095 [Clostridia bacterium]|nr:hypothetical protein [Clostridia bacterium]
MNKVKKIFMERDYLEEYNEALDELYYTTNISDEKRAFLISKMEEIADSAVNEAVRNEKIKNALNEYSDIENLKIKMSSGVFLGAVITAVGSEILQGYGVNPELMQNINTFAENLATITGSVTLAFATVGFACKVTAAHIKKDLETLKGQIGRIAVLPHNKLKERVEEDQKE